MSQRDQNASAGSRVGIPVHQNRPKSVAKQLPNSRKTVMKRHESIERRTASSGAGGRGAPAIRERSINRRHVYTNQTASTRTCTSTASSPKTSFTRSLPIHSGALPFSGDERSTGTNHNDPSSLESYCADKPIKLRHVIADYKMHMRTCPFDDQPTSRCGSMRDLLETHISLPRSPSFIMNPLRTSKPSSANIGGKFCWCLTNSSFLMQNLLVFGTQRFVNAKFSICTHCIFVPSRTRHGLWIY